MESSGAGPLRKKACNAHNQDARPKGTALLGLDWEVGGFPGGEAAGNFGDGGEVGTLKETGGEGGAVATGAVDE
jgi:hypothetical protein